MAERQRYPDKPATTLGWSELLDELEAACIDYGVDLDYDTSATLYRRTQELRAEVNSRIMKLGLISNDRLNQTRLAKILGGEPL